MDNLFDILNQSKTMDSQKWHIHQTVFNSLIGLDTSLFERNYSAHEQINIVTQALRKGYFGNLRKSSTSTNYPPMDIFDVITPNALDLYCEQFGAKENFVDTNGAAVSLSPYWFTKGNFTVSLKHQHTLIMHITGSYRHLSSDTKNRRSIYYID